MDLQAPEVGSAPVGGRRGDAASAERGSGAVPRKRGLAVELLSTSFGNKAV